MSWQFSDIWSLNKILNDIRWWWLGHSCFLWLFVISEKINDECYDGYIVYRNVSFKKKKQNEGVPIHLSYHNMFFKKSPFQDPNQFIKSCKERLGEIQWRGGEAPVGNDPPPNLWEICGNDPKFVGNLKFTWRELMTCIFLHQVS